MTDNEIKLLRKKIRHYKKCDEDQQHINPPSIHKSLTNVFELITYCKCQDYGTFLQNVYNIVLRQLRRTLLQFKT